MIERKGTFIMSMVGWLCLPALALSFMLSIPPVSQVAALARTPDATGSVVGTLRRDLSMFGFSQDMRRKRESTDPFDVSESYRLFLPNSAFRDRQVNCLAKNIWHESRGEDARGQLAVGLVTLNRMETGNWPSTVCEVVYQPGQFSWTMDPNLRNSRPGGEKWQQIMLLSATLLHRRDLFDDITDGATYFHAAYIKPGWTNLRRTIRLGDHVFYKAKDESGK